MSNDLHAELVIGSGHVRILTGRTEPDGSPEVLIGAHGQSDLHAIRRLLAFVDHALTDKAKP